MDRFEEIMARIDANFAAAAKSRVEREKFLSALKLSEEKAREKDSAEAAHRREPLDLRNYELDRAIAELVQKIEDLVAKGWRL